MSKHKTILSAFLFFGLFFLIGHQAFAEKIPLKVIRNNTKLLNKPAKHALVIRLLIKDTKIIGLKQEGDFYQVQLTDSAIAHSQNANTDGPDSQLTSTQQNQAIVGYVNKQDVQLLQDDRNKQAKKKAPQKKRVKKKDKIFLMGMGMLRLNWTKVEGDEVRFRSSDLGLPADLSTRERASFMVDGTLGHGKYDIKGNLNYDPETRITEPPLEFLLTVGNDNKRITVGDNRSGVFLDSMFTRYMHPFRGLSAQLRSKKIGIEVVVGLARGETGIDEIPTDIGAGPYSLNEAPVLRGSETVFLIVKSKSNPENELKRIRMVRNSDYYIDYDRGDIVFSYPLYSTDPLGNPQYLLIKYQYESIAGSFTRGIGGIRGFIEPFNFMKLHFSYIADMDKDIDFSEAFENRRGIFSAGFEINTKRATLFTEFAMNDENTDEKQYAYFGGGVINFSKKLHLYLNAWDVDSQFPTFANRQMEYGFNLFQIYPVFSQRTIFLSPFQFTRNLGTQLFPFSLLSLSVDERESNGFMEWDDGKNVVNFGYGRRDGISDGLKNRTFYLSAFRDQGSYQAWAKFQGDNSFDEGKTGTDMRIYSYLAGWRQRLVKTAKGGVFVQVDYNGEDSEDFLDLQEDSFRHSASVSLEYLKESEGIFGAYRKDLLLEKGTGTHLAEADILELGLKYHFFKNFFIDSRYRDEKNTIGGVETTTNLISLGAGFEGERFRGLARYEVQVNETDSQEGRRELWSIFLFGSPVKRMSLSLKYYRQKGRDNDSIFLSERSEEQLSFRLLYKPIHPLTLYSQWRYDINAELAPPLNEIESNSLASIQGLKLQFMKKFEFLANYKLLKIWGPIKNKKEAYAAELGYLIHKNFRLGIGYEVVRFDDTQIPENNYNSNTGYFKIVAIF